MQIAHSLQNVATLTSRIALITRIHFCHGGKQLGPKEKLTARECDPLAL